MAKHDGGPAFPVIGAPGSPEDYPGLSLRDYFAAKAMAGVLQTCASHEGSEMLDKLLGVPYTPRNGIQWMVARAYQIADAMLAERSK